MLHNLLAIFWQKIVYILTGFCQNCHLTQLTSVVLTCNSMQSPVVICKVSRLSSR